MKKKVIFSLILGLILMLSLSNVAFADDGITVNLDGTQLVFDVQPQLIDGRTMVPLRVIFEALGATVEWDDATSTVTAYNESYMVKATINSTTMSVNGNEIQIDVPPMLVDGRTLVPARFVAEAFGCGVEWEDATQTVYITSGVDYSQTQNLSNVNVDAYEELRRIIIRNDRYTTGDDKNYTIDYFPERKKDYKYYMSLFLDAEDGSIMLNYSWEDSDSKRFLTINLSNDRCPFFTYLLTVSNVRHFLIGEFPYTNESFAVLRNDSPPYFHEFVYKLLGYDFGLMDLILQRYGDITFEDLGIYYEIS